MGEICLRDSAESEVVGYLYGIFGLGWGFAVCLLCACGELCESLIDLSHLTSLSLSFFFFFFWKMRSAHGALRKKGPDRKSLNAFASP